MNIAVIGAGSHFNLALLRAVYQTPTPEPIHLALMDVRKRPLQALQRLIPLLNAATGKRVTFSTGTDRRRALKGADHVLVSFAVDFPHSFLRTCDVMHRHGIEFQEGETATPGALMATLRHLPPLIGAVQDVMVSCPQAWVHVINNPLPRLLRGVIKATGYDRLIGHCHGTLEVIERLAILNDVPKDAIDVFVAGINHFHILQRAVDTRSGDDLLARLATLPADKKLAWERMDRTQFVLFEDLGYFFGCGQWHNFDYVPLAHQRLKPQHFFTWDGCCRVDARNKDKGAEIGSRLKTKGAVTAFLAEPEREQMFKVMLALNGLSKPYHFLSGNAPNQGRIRFLPRETIVELPATVSGKGLRLHRPLMELPRVFQTWVQIQTAIQELTVDAVLQKSRRLAVETIASDPAMRDCDCSPGHLLNEMLEVNAGLVPELGP